MKKIKSSKLVLLVMVLFNSKKWFFSSLIKYKSYCFSDYDVSGDSNLENI